MKTILQITTSLIIFSYLVFTQVQVDSIDVQANFFGPFNKTTAEIYFVNYSNLDSLETRFIFSINQSSIISNLWLQINNQMKKAETFGRRTGTNIYREIIGRRIDPALLFKIDNGRYSLNVFPIRKNKRTKVIIEYYSILETDASGVPAWYFNSSQIEEANKTLTLESQQPENTIGDFNNLNRGLKQAIILTGKSVEQFQKTIKQIDRYYIAWNYKYIFNNQNYYNSSCQYKQTIKPTKIDNGKKQNTYFAINTKEIFIPLTLKKLLKTVKQSDSTFVELFGHDEMTKDLLIYLSINKNVSFKINNNRGWLADKSNWHNDNNKTIYIDSNFQLNPIIEKFKTTSNSTKIYCPFLNIYSEYLESLSKPFSYQEEKGYLNSRLSKIVIEDDKRALQIKDRWVKVEKESDFNNNNIEEEPMYFVAVEEMPEPIGGIKFFEDRLFYPIEDTIITGNHKVYVKTLVNKIGKPSNIEIIKSDDILLSKISRFVVSLSDWKPGKQRGKPVVVAVMLPIKFYSDSVKTEQNKDKIKSYVIDKRVFKIKISNRKCYLFEEDYNSTKSKRLEFKSEKFFDLLYEHPEFIEPVYKALYQSKLDGLGIKLTNKNNKRISYFIAN